MEACEECGGHGVYWTEWSDKADADPSLARLIVERPDPPDGVVCIRCTSCDAYPRWLVERLPLDLEERRTVLRWMLAEWNTYSNAKFNLVDVPAEQRDDHDRSMREHGFTSQVDDAFWFRQVTQYFKRAELFGVDTPQGRQAMMKGLMTLFDCCACMVRVHGDPPAPGVSSGDIREWEP